MAILVYTESLGLAAFSFQILNTLIYKFFCFVILCARVFPNVTLVFTPHVFVYANEQQRLRSGTTHGGIFHCVWVWLCVVWCVCMLVRFWRKKNIGVLLLKIMYSKGIYCYIYNFFFHYAYFSKHERTKPLRIYGILDEHVISSPIFVSYVRKKKGVLFLFLRLLTLYEIRFTLKCIRPHREILCAWYITWWPRRRDLSFFYFFYVNASGIFFSPIPW